MRPAKISDDKLFQELSDVFRRKGYDGASYSDLMKATGWQAHSVRGFLSGQLGKKMGLRIRSFQRDGERVYVIKG